MGLNFVMEPGKGPVCLNTLKEISDISRVTLPLGNEASLQANYDAIFLTRLGLEGQVPLFGFCGSAWTLMTYIVENKTGNYSKAKEWLNKYPLESKGLLNLINKALILHMNNQIQAGAQLIQIFDSSGDLLSKDDYLEFSLTYSHELACNLKKNHPSIPVIYFPRGQYGCLREILTNKKYEGFDGISLDHVVDIEEVRKWANATGKVLQGNLDPGIICGNQDIIAQKTKDMINKFGVKNYIANLGHGVWPEHEIEKLRCFVDTVVEYSNNIIKHMDN